MSIVKVVIINGPNTGVNAKAVKACAAALTIQAKQHFALPPPFGYGISAQVRAGVSTNPGEWVMYLLEKPDAPGALGYHDQTADGQPILKIFPLLDEQDGVRWETTASHELLETLADPNIARAAQSYDGKFWAYEVCDACENESYLINGVPVSDFVLPPYFEPTQNVAKYDYLGKITKPLQILPGGYGQYFDPSKGWQQVLHSEVGPRAYRVSAHGRGKIRATDGNS
jgi:hypothetical protein